MDLCIPFFSVCIDSRWYEICFLFCLYYTLNLDPFLPREFTNVKQLPIHFISFQRLFSSNKTQQQIWSSEKMLREKKSMFHIIYYMIENTDECWWCISFIILCYNFINRVTLKIHLCFDNAKQWKIHILTILTSTLVKLQTLISPS